MLSNRVQCHISSLAYALALLAGSGEVVGGGRWQVIATALKVKEVEANLATPNAHDKIAALVVR
jgi:hypothetical protein